MAKNQLKQAAQKIGEVMGKADRTAHKTAHKVAKAGEVAKEELVQLGKQVESLKRQIEKTTKRLKHALR